MSMRRLLLVMPFALMVGHSHAPAQEQAGGVTVYRKFDELVIRDTGRGPALSLPITIQGSAGLKLAFTARATGGIRTANLNMFDAVSKDNTTARSYAWVDESWRPILYRCDRFKYNGGNVFALVKPDTSYQNIRFHGDPTPGNAGVLYIRDLVVYRGDDVAPPEAPTGLTANTQGSTVRLEWQVPKDNVGVAVYSIARATSTGKFVKVAQTSEPSYVDVSAAAGTNRYRVLASDFQDNMSEWSEAAAAEVASAGSVATATVYETDRLGYAAEIRRIREEGRGKTVNGLVLQYGDSLTGAMLYKLMAEAAVGRYMVDALGREGWTSRHGRDAVAQDVAKMRPEFCFILFGTNNVKDGRAVADAMKDLLAIAQTCAAAGAIPAVATIPPRGFSDPKSEREANYNAALIKTMRANHVPIAYLFEEFQRQPDRHMLLDTDGVHWARDGFRVTSLVWKQLMDQISFALLDRPE
jgi:GDSL-like lipase/acylhydrolase family protein